MHISESIPRGLVRLALSSAFLAVVGVATPLNAQSEPLLTPPPSVTNPTSNAGATTELTSPATITPQADTVLEIRILGNDTIPASQIDHHISTRVGRPFEQSIVQQDVRRLANLGWFVDVKPLYKDTPQGRIVIFQVFERPTIRYVNYLGNKKVNDKNLAKQTNLKSGGAVDPYAVEEGRRKLLEYYEGRGHNNVQITIMEGTKATDKGIVYLINEGTPEKIGTLAFVGNEFVSNGRLKTLIKSKPPKFGIYKGFLNRELIEVDVDRLTSYYRSFGYFRARVSRKLDYRPGGKKVDLTYVINEGPRYKIRNVRFMGNTIFEPTAFAETAKLRAGQEFEQTKVRADQQWIQELYGSHGYVYADIRPETVFLEEPGEVDLIYHIEEGEQFRVGNIIVNIGGDNPHTRIQTVLNQLTLRPGDTADLREFNASRRRIQGSNIFHVDPAANIRPEVKFQISEEGAEYEMARRSQSQMRSRRSSPTSSPSSGSPSMGGMGGGRSRGMGGMRGQSPEKSGPLVLPPPQTEVPVIRGQSPPTAVRTPAWAKKRKWQRPQSSAATTTPATATPATRISATRTTAARIQTARKPNNPYLDIRGQSPATPVRQAYATVPTNGQPQYGGQLVGATGPTSKALYTPNTTNRYTQTPARPTVNQTQYTENLPPPAGSFGPTPGFSANAVPGYQLFPDGHFGLPGQPYPQQTVDIIVNTQETQTGRLMFGVGVNSDAGLVGNIVLDERNFDWRRWPTNGFEDFRNGTAFRGDQQRFRIDASPGSEVNRYLVSFTEPYLFDTPNSLGLSGSFFDRRFRDWDEERIGGRISIGRRWVEKDLTANLAYRGENVTITDAPNAGSVQDLADALGSNSLHGFKIGLTNDTRDSAFLPTQGRYLEVSGEYVTGTFNYPRVMIDYRRFFLLHERPDHSGRHVLSFSTNIGWQGEDAPIYEHFFAGGHSTMRGFDFRGASPVDIATGVEIGGEFQWLNSLQYLFPITADEMLHGVVFCDFGTVETDTEINDFRIVPGVGLRVAVPALGPAPIALDFGWAVNHADTDDRQVFSFSMGFGRN